MGNIGTWQLVIVLAIVLLLFGAKRLPEAARGLGRSLKIFKTETQGLVGGDEKSSDDAADTTTGGTASGASTTGSPANQPAEQRAVEPTPSGQASEPVDEQSKREA